MPGTEKQRKAAGAELGRRREGAPRQEHATRPFGSASTEALRDFARKDGNAKKSTPRRSGR